MKLQITASDFELSPELEKYALEKLERIEKRIPRRLRAVCAAELTFMQGQKADRKQNTCELTLKVPRDELSARETTQHIYAALDIAAGSVEQQLKDYVARQQRSLSARLKRGFGGDGRSTTA